MDHVLEGMKAHYEVMLDLFLEEQRTGKHKTFSNNPFYGEVKALIASMNISRKYLGWDPIRLKDEVEFYL